jgi:hypothetical protein
LGRVNALAIDPLTPTTVYAATEAGVFDIEQVASPAAASPTPTSTPTPITATTNTPSTYTPMPSATTTSTETIPTACLGDCNGDQRVKVDELVMLVNLALGNPESCPSGVPAGATVDVSLVLTAVNHALNGCGG